MQPSDQAKARTASIFDRASTTYGQVGPGYFAYLGQQLVERAGLAPGMRVLDVACGRGAVLFPAAQTVGATGSVVGIDLSEGMVQATNAEIARWHWYDDLLKRYLPAASRAPVSARSAQMQTQEHLAARRTPSRSACPCATNAGARATDHRADCVVYARKLERSYRSTACRVLQIRLTG